MARLTTLNGCVGSKTGHPANFLDCLFLAGLSQLPSPPSEIISNGSLYG